MPLRDFKGPGQIETILESLQILYPTLKSYCVLRTSKSGMRRLQGRMKLRAIITLT
jgi:hypothetical protein